MPDRGMTWGDFQKETLYKGGYNRLRNWKEDGDIEVWIHTNSAFFKRLFIMVPYVGEEEDERTKRVRSTIKYFPYVSHEEIDDFISRKKNGRYYRCPLLRLIDWITDNGYIDDDQTVYDASIGDKKRDRICSKADFIGDKDAGGAWQLSMKPSLQYVMAVVDNGKPKDGIVVTAEKFSLGEAIKRAVRQEVDRKGPEHGDPSINPYCFKWVFDANSRSPGNYYQAYPIERVELTDEISGLLDEPAQDISEWVQPGDTDFLLNILKAHVTLDDVPWDELFDNVHDERSTFGTANLEGAVSSAAPVDAPARGTKKPKKAPAPEPDPEPDEDSSADDGELVDCPTCKGKGKRRNRKCKVCDGSGKVEAPEAEEAEESEEPPPPPPKKQRKARARKPAPPPEPEEEEGDECGVCNKIVPYDATSCPHCGVTFEA